MWSPEKLHLGRLSTDELGQLPKESADFPDGVKPKDVSTSMRIGKNVEQYEKHERALRNLQREDRSRMSASKLKEHHRKTRTAEVYSKMAEDKIIATFAWARERTLRYKEDHPEEVDEEELSTKMDSMSLEELEAYMVRRRTEAEGVDAEEVRMLCVCLSDLLSTLQSELSEAEVSDSELFEEKKKPPPKAKKIILAKKE